MYLSPAPNNYQQSASLKSCTFPRLKNILKQIQNSHLLCFIFIMIRMQCKVYPIKILKVEQSNANDGHAIAEQISRTYPSCITETSPLHSKHQALSSPHSIYGASYRIVVVGRKTRQRERMPFPLLEMTEGVVLIKIILRCFSTDH